jgi:hypothetical protein
MGRKKKQSFLDEVISLSGKEAPEVYQPLGMYYQKWNWYKNESKRSFPLELIPSLQFHSGLSERTFWALMRKHFPPK